MATLHTGRTYVSGADLAGLEGSLVSQDAVGALIISADGVQVAGVLISAVLRTKGDDGAGGYSRDMTNEGCICGMESNDHYDTFETAEVDDAIVPGMNLAADGTGKGVRIALTGDFPIGVATSLSKGGCVDVNIKLSSIALV